jgi:hypothetical protein
MLAIVRIFCVTSSPTVPSPRVAARWASVGGYVPLRQAWRQEKAWRPLAQWSPPAFSSTGGRGRTTDPEVVRATTEWVSALKALFGEKRLPVDTVLDQLDATLGGSRP